MIAHGRHPQVDETSPINFLQGRVLEALPASAMEQDLEIRESARVCAWELKRRGRGSCGTGWDTARGWPNRLSQGLEFFCFQIFQSFLASRLAQVEAFVVCYARCNDIGGLLSHKARPGTTGYDRVRPGTTGYDRYEVSGYVRLALDWFNSTTWKMWRDKDGQGPDRDRTRTRIEW